MSLLPTLGGCGPLSSDIYPPAHGSPPQTRGNASRHAGLHVCTRGTGNLPRAKRHSECGEGAAASRPCLADRRRLAAPYHHRRQHTMGRKKSAGGFACSREAAAGAGSRALGARLRGAVRHRAAVPWLASSRISLPACNVLTSRTSAGCLFNDPAPCSAWWSG